MTTLGFAMMAVIAGTVSPAASSDVAPAEGAQTEAYAGRESADQHLTQMVSEYRRPMLDRGGWRNPYLRNVALGNPLLAAAVGGGVTTPGAVAGQLPRRDVAASPGKASDEEEGAASGEPEVEPPANAQPPAK
jgi:hypothetical protein